MVDHLPARGKTEGLASGRIIPGVGRRTFSSTIKDVVAACAICQTALVDEIKNRKQSQQANYQYYETWRCGKLPCRIVEQSILITNIKINISIKMFRPQVQSTKIPMETKSIDHNQNYFVAIFLRTDKNWRWKYWKGAIKLNVNG